MVTEQVQPSTIEMTFDGVALHAVAGQTLSAALINSGIRTWGTGNTAAGPGQITGLVIVQPISLDHQVAPAQHGFTLHHRVQIGVAKQPLTGYKGRQRTA